MSLFSYPANSRGRGLCFAAALCVGAGLVAPRVEAASDPYNVLFENGPSANRVDIVFIGDGYRESELSTTYASHTQDALDYFFGSSLNNPLPRYQSFFNAYRVNVASAQSGADDPNAGVYVDTALDATYNTAGIDRLLTFNNSKANAAVNNALLGTGIDVDMRFGTVNTTKYGGSGGAWATWAGGSYAALEIGIHEVAHSFADLADEYFYSPATTHSGGEFSEWNATNSPTSGKWDRWLGYDDPATNIGPIGYYEGGRYHTYGAWRPSDNSKMRSLNRPFDAVSREKLIHDIYQEVDPLDGWLETSGIKDATQPLWVDRVDDTVISLQWSINGQPIAETSDTLDLGTLGLAPGLYDVEVRAYDNILDHSYTGGALDWWRLDQAMLEQTLAWQVDVAGLLGDLNGDGALTNADISAFVLALTAPNDYATTYPGLDPDVLGDFTGDNALTNADIAGFVAALTGNTSAGIVPEPASLALLGLGGLLVTRRR